MVGKSYDCPNPNAKALKVSAKQADTYPDSKVHGANMGPIWGRQDPGGPHVGPMDFAIRVTTIKQNSRTVCKGNISTYFSLGPLLLSWFNLNITIDS